VKQVDDAGSGIAHGFHWWLIDEEVAAVDRIVKMLPGGIAFALEIFGSVDSTLSANRVGALDRHYGKEVHVSAHLGDLDDCRESCQAAADHDDFGVSCHSDPLLVLCDPSVSSVVSGFEWTTQDTEVHRISRASQPLPTTSQAAAA